MFFRKRLAAARTRLGPLVQRASPWLYWTGWLGLGAGVLLQAFVRDRVPGLALAFYAMPKPCLAGLAAVLMLWPWIRRGGRAVAGLTFILITLWWFGTSWCTPPATTRSDPGRQEVKILYWNLCRPGGLHRGMVELMKETQPDVAAFVEPGPQAGKLCPTYEELLPGYKADWMPRGILWLSRVPSRYRDRGKLEAIGAFAWFEVETLGPTFPVVVADVFPHVFRSRKGQLDEALSHARGRSDALIVGDFNTPLESVLWSGFRGNYTHAFEAAGSGFKETWPIGLPLLSLDHVWVGKDWEIVAARKLWRLTGSDHAALLVTVRRK